jgi:polyphosphate kinase 2 (PPK2 family)
VAHHKHALTHALKKMKKTHLSDEEIETEIRKLQLTLLKIQLGLKESNAKVIFMFEGFDAAGKGGAIKALTEFLDPRGYEVYPIGAPTKEEVGKHWLYRFWTRLPSPGHISIFDRSWYGRVLVEKIDELTPKAKIERAYEEINQFEKVLQNDDVHIMKFFLATSKEEQLERFEARLKDPAKVWKVSLDDIRARGQWDQYVEATDLLIKRTNTEACPWHLIVHDKKKEARLEILRIVVERLQFAIAHLDSKAEKEKRAKFAKSLEKELKSLKK